MGVWGTLPNSAKKAQWLEVLGTGVLGGEKCTGSRAESGVLDWWGAQDPILTHVNQSVKAPISFCK